MKKTTLAIAILSSLTAAHAGTMGPVATPPTYVPYLAGEASYTWAQTNNITVNSVTATKSSNQGWGGRLGAGVLFPVNDTWSAMTEIGGGYYGSQTQSIVNGTGTRALYNSFTLDGYDVLAGGMYKWDMVGLFLQGGFMVENLRSTSTQNISLVTGSTFLKGTVSNQRITTNVFPEIKVGGIYNVTPNWGLSVAYMHVFGGTPSFNETFSGSAATGIVTNGTSNLQNPTLNSILFGVRYNFT